MAGFADIIGHQQIISHLKKAIAQDMVSHAYIFDGADDAGKRMLAEAFAMTLQCETIQQLYGKQQEQQMTLFGAPSDDSFTVSDEALARARQTEPCMECRSCRQALSKNQPDIIYVTHEKKSLSVDDVREQINNSIRYKPYSSRRKVYLVDEAEKMTVQAQNALLKTFEEPPAYAVMLLLTNNAELFLPTVRSRGVMLSLKAVSNEEIRQFLMRQYQVPDYQADFCVTFAQGNVGRAMKLVNAERFSSLKDQVLQLMRRLDAIGAYQFTKELAFLKEDEENLADFLDLLLLLFRDVLLYKATAATEQLVFKKEAHTVVQLAQKSTYAGLQQTFRAIETAKVRIRLNINDALVTELLLLSIKENFT